MKFLRKVNIGAVISVIILTIVVVYMVTLTSKYSDLKKQSDIFMTSFFNENADCVTIPENYRNDYDNYIKSIEEKIKPYFYDDESYNKYLETFILPQFSSNFIANDISANSEMFRCAYDGEHLEVDFKVDCFGTVISTLTETDDGLKITSINLGYDIFQQNLYY